MVCEEGIGNNRMTIQKGHFNLVCSCTERYAVERPSTRENITIKLILIILYKLLYIIVIILIINTIGFIDEQST